jgi:hypothetical protein
MSSAGDAEKDTEPLCGETEPLTPSILPRERMVVFAQATFAILIILLTLSLIDLARNDDLDVSMQAAKTEIDKLPAPESEATPTKRESSAPEASGVITLEPGKVGEFNFNLVTHKACQNVKTLRLADHAVANVHRACRGRVHAYAGVLYTVTIGIEADR